ncbi:MAG: outer membrane beta-barrel protein [Deltaproteobacteria bacterium]|nr:outer membrane beta-barrel protein [Deltaproteobacteria bacterium]
MKGFGVFILTLAILACAFPSHVLAQGANYVTFKPGIYSPQSSDLEDFDTGFNGELAFGHRYNRNFAVEMGVGYFKSEADYSAAGQVSGINYSFHEEDTIDAIPVTLSFKGIIPYDRWEFFGMGGIGVYFTDGEAEVNGTVDGRRVSASLSESDTVFGFHFGVGFHYNITPTWFVGAEGKYLWTNDAKLSGNVRGVPIETNFKMDGIIATAVLGFNF